MMKKLTNLALMSAIAFLGAVGFTACTSTDDTVAETNPNYNPETGEVTTDFVFNLSLSNTPSSTRMTAADTQADVTSSAGFRGIDNSQLLTFKLDDDGMIVSSAQAADKIYGFGTVLGSGTLDPTNGSADGNIPKSRRVIEISLPTETNTMITYGKAIKTKSDNAQGKISYNVGQNLADVSFSLQKIVPHDVDPDYPLQNEATFLQYENLIADVLTDIINSSIPSQTFVFGSESKTITTALKWSDYVEVEVTGGTKKLVKKTTSAIDPTKPVSSLGEILGNAFVNMNTIQTDELRAGSSDALVAMMRDLIAVVTPVANAEPTTVSEVAAKAVGQAIKDQVEKFFDANNNHQWKSTAAVKAAATVTDADMNKVSESSNLNDFPRDFKLPLGSVILEFLIGGDATAGYTFTYAYKGTVETYAMGGSSDQTDGFNPLNYVYPAELCYFGNSPLRVTDQTIATKDFPDGVNNWDTESSWAGKGWVPRSHVQASTRSVAMQYNINYGTALLETKVRYRTDILKDNNKHIQETIYGATGEEDNEIDAKSAPFELTGVLVGGQEDVVGWDFLAKSSTPGFGHMVYDNVTTATTEAGVTTYTGVAIPEALDATSGGNPSNPVYTLLWDNWQASLKDQKQRDVYVALEFKNKGTGFWGKNNYIREGATFYIVGKLDPNAGSNTDASDLSQGITWPDNQALPPYDTDGSTIKQRRVFMQDFKTSATFVFDENSLKEALVSVPDLRSGQISLGLSVDLQWQTGLTFPNVILGE